MRPPFYTSYLTGVSLLFARRPRRVGSSFLAFYGVSFGRNTTNITRALVQKEALYRDWVGLAY